MLVMDLDDTYVDVMPIQSGSLRVAPFSIFQLVGVANPSTQEPVRIASTTLAILLQSSAHDKTSYVGRDDGVSKI